MARAVAVAQQRDPTREASVSERRWDGHGAAVSRAGVGDRPVRRGPGDAVPWFRSAAGHGPPQADLSGRSGPSRI